MRNLFSHRHPRMQNTLFELWLWGGEDKKILWELWSAWGMGQGHNGRLLCWFSSGPLSKILIKHFWARDNDNDAAWIKTVDKCVCERIAGSSLKTNSPRLPARHTLSFPSFLELGSTAVGPGKWMECREGCLASFSGPCLAPLSLFNELFLHVALPGRSASISLLQRPSWREVRAGRWLGNGP